MSDKVSSLLPDKGDASDDRPNFKLSRSEYGFFLGASSLLVLLLVVLSTSWTKTTTYQAHVASLLPARIYESLPSSPFELDTIFGFLARHITPPDPKSLYLDEWIEWQEEQAWRGILSNIHPEGTKEGCVVASPSTEKPDYWYQWTRDSALVMRTVINSYTKGKLEYRPLIDEYIQAVKFIQHQETLVGGFHTGGLGEVKYHVDGRPFMGEWGRPQADGPAARTITLVKWAEWLLDEGTKADKQFIKDTLYDGEFPTESVIKGDLEYLSHNWRQAGFDLWEEVSGSHFYTLLSTERALIAGASLAERLSDPKAAEWYRSQAAEITALLPSFYSNEKGLITVTLNHTVGRDSEENAHKGDDLYGKKSELDAAILLAVLHSGEGSEWTADNDRVVATLDKLIRAFHDVYPINEQRNIPALGRYPEDRYDGVGLSFAHPWFICTLSAAEILHRSSRLIQARKTPLVLTNATVDWYGRFVVGATVGRTVAPLSDEMLNIARGEALMASGFFNIVKEFSGRNGSMHEQFDRETGEGRGARDLTWSYAAFTTAAEAKRGWPKGLPPVGAPVAW